MSKDRQLADQRSRNRIISALDRNLLVEAGAGSGKTHMMAARMAAGIASGAHDVEHMAAVTFTRKAAAELRGRFQLALEAELRSDASLQGSEPERAVRIRSALSNLERFFAGTIHSFCAQLLRERPVESSVSPGFTEMDEVEDALLRSQTWRDFVTHLGASGNPEMLELLDAGVRPADLDQAFRTVCLYEEVDFPPGEGRKPKMVGPWAALDEFWAALREKLPMSIPGETTCPTQKAARRFFGQMRVATVDRDRPGTLASLLETWDFSPKIVQKCWSDDAAAKKRLATEICDLHRMFRTDAVVPFLSAWRQYLYRLVVTLLTRARCYAAAERSRRNTLNYGDLLHMAARVLRGNPHVRLALQQKYRWLFVDEFQDTDPVQAEIIFLLAADDRAPNAEPSVREADWHMLPLRPGALFVVGDPKQSIYRFRRADIDIYNQVRARLQDPRNGEVLSLTTNFRSVPALCDWANDVFKQQFPANSTTHSPQFAPLDPHRPSDRGVAGVYTLTVPTTIEQSKAPQDEANRIAQFIRAEVDAGRRLFGDFLILTRRKKLRLLPYVQALESLQVPIEVSGAGAFGESEEVEQLTLLLRALCDPQDSASLVGVLRGPLFGISDPELFAYRQSGGWFSIFSGERDSVSGPDSGSAGLQAGSGGGAVTSALASLRQMFRWTRVLPAGAALERILEITGYLALAATSPGGVEAGDLLHAVDRIRQVLEDGHSLAEAADALEADGEASSEIESLPLEPAQSDVVRLMNLHKAKGLEASVVFLADPYGGFHPRVDIRIIRDGSRARGYFSIKSERSRQQKVLAEPAGWGAYEAEEQAYLEAEENRLLYVAATRARDVLVVSRWAKAGNRSMRAWGGFVPFLASASELPIPAHSKAAAPRSVDFSSEARVAAGADRRAAHERARVPSWSTTSVTRELRYVAKIARSTETAPEDPTRVIVADTPSHRADVGLAWGTLIHGLLEHAMRYKNATRDDLRRLAVWLTVEELELRAVIEDALDTVEAVAQADFWSEARQAREQHVEVPFAISRGPGQLLSGVVDLAFGDGHGWAIRDYKTDMLADSPELEERYRSQLRSYGEAWEKVTGTATQVSIAPIVRIRR
jgi:ATP-dependent helicase/nuclease subunit A